MSDPATSRQFCLEQLDCASSADDLSRCAWINICETTCFSSPPPACQLHLDVQEEDTPSREPSLQLSRLVNVNIKSSDAHSYLCLSITTPSAPPYLHQHRHVVASPTATRAPAWRKESEWFSHTKTYTRNTSIAQRQTCYGTGRASCRNPQIQSRRPRRCTQIVASDTNGRSWKRT